MGKTIKKNGKMYENPELLKEFALDVIKVLNNYIQDEKNKIKEDDVIKRITDPKRLQAFKESIEHDEYIEERREVSEKYKEDHNIQYANGFNRVVYSRIKLPNEGQNKKDNEEFLKNACNASFVAKIYNENIKKAYSLDFKKIFSMSDEEKINFYKENQVFCDEMFVMNSAISGVPININAKVSEDLQNKKSMFESLAEGKELLSLNSNYMNLIIPNLSSLKNAELTLASFEINSIASKYMGKVDDFYAPNKLNPNQVIKINDDIIATTENPAKAYYKELANKNIIDKNFTTTKAFFGIKKGQETRVSADTTLSLGKEPTIKDLSKEEVNLLKEGLNEKLLVPLDECEKAYDDFTSKKNIKKLSKIYKQLTKTESKKDTPSKEFDDVKKAYEDILNDLNNAKNKKNLEPKDKAKLIDEYNKKIDNLKEKIDIYEEKEIAKESVKNNTKNYDKCIKRLDIMAEMVNSLNGPITELYKEEPTNELTTQKIEVNEVEDKHVEEALINLNEPEKQLENEITLE